MLLACTKNWRNGVPLSVVAQVVGGHPRPIRVSYVGENRMISNCMLLRTDDFAQYSSVVSQQKEEERPI